MDPMTTMMMGEKQKILNRMMMKGQKFSYKNLFFAVEICITLGRMTDSPFSPFSPVHPVPAK
jgi:hypothetical protein